MRAIKVRGFMNANAGRLQMTRIVRAGLAAAFAVFLGASVLDASTAQGPEVPPLPLGFEENQGQSDAQIKFLARGNGCGVFLTPSEVVLVLCKAVNPPDPTDMESFLTSSEGVEYTLLRMKFVGGNADPTVSGLEVVT